MKRILSLLCAVLLCVPAGMQASQPSNATIGGIAALGLGFGYFGYGAYRANKYRTNTADLKQLQTDFLNIGRKNVAQAPIFERTQAMRKSRGLATKYTSDFGDAPENAVAMAIYGVQGLDMGFPVDNTVNKKILQPLKNENINVFNHIEKELPKEDQVYMRKNVTKNLNDLDYKYKRNTYALAGLSALCLGGAAVVGWFGWKK